MGSADEVRVWDRALTAQEITTQYDNGVFDTTGQVLHLPFDADSSASTNQAPVANPGQSQIVPLS